jgi:hypothetical protein
MGKTIGQFDYSIKAMKKEFPLPFDPQVLIHLQHWGMEDGAPLVSASLMSESEIDRHIQDLKDDLDAVGKRAKAALVRAKAQTKAIVSERVENALEIKNL